MWCTVTHTSHILRSVTFSPENNTANVIMWKNMEEPDRPRMTIYGGCALHARYLRLQTHTIILTAFTRQQLLRERAWLLRYTHTACLVTLCESRATLFSVKGSNLKLLLSLCFLQSKAYYFGPVLQLSFQLLQTFCLKFHCSLHAISSCRHSNTPVTDYSRRRFF